MLICLAYFVSTLVLPAITTYRILSKEEAKASETSLWSIYWAFYALLFLLKCLMPFLHLQTFQILIMLFMVWLYNDNYKGGLYLKDLLKGLCEQNEYVSTVISTLKDLNLTLKVLDEQESKTSSE